MAEACAQYQRVLELDPDDIAALNDLAWILATCPDDSLRDGAKAVKLAEKAAQLCHSQSPEVLDTLAAADAEAGNFSEAVQTVKNASSLAAAQNRQSLELSLQTRLSLYRSNIPFRDVESPTQPASPGP